MNFYKCTDGTYSCRTADDLNEATLQLLACHAYDEALESNKAALYRIENKVTISEKNIKREKVRKEIEWTTTTH